VPKRCYPRPNANLGGRSYDKNRWAHINGAQAEPVLNARACRDKNVLWQRQRAKSSSFRHALLSPKPSDYHIICSDSVRLSCVGVRSNHMCRVYALLLPFGSHACGFIQRTRGVPLTPQSSIAVARLTGIGSGCRACFAVPLN